MSPDEALRLCRMAKSVSPAQAVDEYTPAAWALILKDCRLTDAEQALAELGGEQEWIHVSHIVQRVKRIRRDRVLDFGTLPDPPSHIDPDDQRAHSRWLRETTEAIADGTYERPAPPSVTAKRDVIRELGQVGQPVDLDEMKREVRARNDAAREKIRAREAEAKRRRDERQAELERMRAADRAARAARCDRTHGDLTTPTPTTEPEEGEHG